MATVPTIEQWVFQKLTQKLGKDPAVVRTEAEFAVTLKGGQDIDKFVKVSDFLVEVLWLSKTDADDLSMQVQEALRSLADENFILQSSLRNESAERSGDTALWSYLAIVQLRHRRRNEWEV